MTRYKKARIRFFDDLTPDLILEDVKIETHMLTGYDILPYNGLTYRRIKKSINLDRVYEILEA